jgi:cysteinyl-tRNA synthetase
MSLFSFFKPKTAERPPLLLHNTLSGLVEPFAPLNHTVKMYNCGPTPYDEQHIGNMVPPYLGNLLRRAFEAWGYPVKQVMNITDFGHLSGGDVGDENTEDKMTLGLRREGLVPTMDNMRTLAEKYTDIFLRDAELLGVDNKKVLYPRASDYIPQMIALIEALEQKGYAYKTSDGVYFDTAKFAGYGKLGGLATGPEAHARVAVNAEKKSAHDFALWKLAQEESALGWPSPWGTGFPGWHIECTAMAFTLLGRQLDIHTGGIEHVPVHHNNELAQAEALTGKPFVRYWLHNAHITIEGKKISKSLSNTVYLHNITDRGLEPRALRYWFLTGHYRTPMNFTWEAIEGANTALLRLRRAYLEAFSAGGVQKEFMDKLYAAIGNDLGTAQALALVWENIKTLNKATLAEADKIFGLGLADARPAAKLSIKQNELPQEIQELVNQREVARKNKDFARADELRGQIEALGFKLEDSPDGPKISLK